MLFIKAAVSEEGQYVAIDLSGKNLRIMLLTLNGSGREPTAVNNNYIVPNHVMKGTGDQVISFMLREFFLFIEMVITSRACSSCSLSLLTVCNVSCRSLV